MILTYDVLSDWVMICTPRTASTALSTMLRLRASHDKPVSESDVAGHYFGHIPASRLAERFGLARWRQTFSFGFVRNPWDRMVSICASINLAKLQNPISFTTWLYDGCLNSEDKPHSVAGGTLIHHCCSYFVLPCSYIGRFETFEADVERICRILGRPVPATQRHEVLPHEPYQSYYTPEAQNWVARHCWQDIHTFGYRFDE